MAIGWLLLESSQFVPEIREPKIMVPYDDDFCVKVIPRIPGMR